MNYALSRMFVSRVLGLIQESVVNTNDEEHNGSHQIEQVPQGLLKDQSGGSLQVSGQIPSPLSL